MLDILFFFHRSLRFCYIFSSLFNLCCSYCMNSVNPFSSSLILSSVLSILLLIPSSKFFIYITVLFISIISIWLFFYNFYFFFLNCLYIFFIYFKRLCKCFSNTFMMAALKPLSDNSNI